MRRCLILTIGLLAAPAAAAEPLTSLAEMARHLGAEVDLRGRVSATPWQHLMNPPPGHGEQVYFDLSDGQTVVYARTTIPCRGGAVVRGTVMMVGGGPKRLGSKIPDEAYREVHLVATGWRCE